MSAVPSALERNGFASNNTTGVLPASFRRVSWGAVIAGMVMAIVIQLVLALVGTAIGLSTIDPISHSSPDASTLGMGAGLWWIATSIIALFVGGWVAAHLSGSAISSDALLHGLLTWGVATLVMVYLVASLVGSAVSGTAAAAAKTADVAATGLKAVAGPAVDAAKQQLAQSGISVDNIKAQAEALLRQTGKPALQPNAIENKAESAANQATSGVKQAGANGGDPMDDLQGTLQRIINSGKATIDQADRDAVVNVVMARTGATREEAEQRVNAWVDQYQEARAKFEQKKEEMQAQARQVADDAASATAKGALGTAVALIVGGIAAALGGLAARRRTVLVAGRSTPVETANVTR